MKDLRTRRSSDLEIDLEGPSDWSRGGAWDTEHQLHRASLRADHGVGGARSR
jgi:hypothetical protein